MVSSRTGTTESQTKSPRETYFNADRYSFNLKGAPIMINKLNVDKFPNLQPNGFEYTVDGKNISSKVLKRRNTRNDLSKMSLFSNPTSPHEQFDI